MGCRPRARSVLRCHGALVLRQGPPREEKQAGRWPMKGGQSPSLELVSKEFRKQRLAPRSVLRCHGALVLRQGPPREDKQASRWPIKGGQSPSLELVSREFRKQRLAPWAAAAGPIRPSLPWCFGAATASFAAMVFWCCDRVRQMNTSKLAGGR